MWKDRVFAPVAAMSLLGAVGCGIPPIDASKVKQLEVISYEGSSFCPTGENKLGVRAKMIDGTVRATDSGDREKQFDAAELAWAVSPSMGKVTSDKLDVAFVANDDTTPTLESNVTLGVAMRQNTAAKGSIVLEPNFSCHQAAQFSAPDGASGVAEETVFSVLAALLPQSRGQSGNHGQHGSHGVDASPIVASVTMVSTPRRGTLAAVRVERVSDSRVGIYYVDPTAGRITILNRGGAGGYGGHGRDGTHGTSGGTCERGGRGGDGGDGGHGGNGGNGGAVTVLVDGRFPDLAKLVRVDNRGGAAGHGGIRGSAGYGGIGGYDSKLKCSPADGPSGRAGQDGMNGQAGMPGPEPQFTVTEPKDMTISMR